VATIGSPAAKSQLSAYGYYCGPTCLNSMCIVFQGADNSPTPVTNFAVANSPLVLMPLAGNNGANITSDDVLYLLFLDGNYAALTGYNGNGYSYVWDGRMRTPPLPSLACLRLSRSLTCKNRGIHPNNASISRSEWNPPTVRSIDS
jgi:hypothetical protein